MHVYAVAYYELSKHDKMEELDIFKTKEEAYNKMLEHYKDYIRCIERYDPTIYIDEDFKQAVEDGDFELAYDLFHKLDEYEVAYEIYERDII